MNILDLLKPTGLTATANLETKKTIHLGKEFTTLINTKENGGLYDTIDWDISRFHYDTEYTPSGNFSGNLHQLTEEISIEEYDSESLASLKGYNPIEALLLANELIKAGALDTSDRITIFLNTKGKDGKEWIRLMRHQDSRCKGDETKLHIMTGYQNISGFTAKAGEKILLP